MSYVAAGTCDSDGVQATPKEFVNGAILLRLAGPSVHTKSVTKWSFSKTLFKLEEFENAGFVF